MQQFREEIAAVVEAQPGHVQGDVFDVAQLTDADAEIWQEVKNGTLTKEELVEYDREAMASENPSRFTFLKIVRNKAMGIFLQRAVEAKKKSEE